MATLTAVPTGRSDYRFAGWAAIASGVACATFLLGLLAFLLMPPQFRTPEVRDILQPINIVALLLQALFLIPAAFALHTLGRRRCAKASIVAVTVAVIALAAIVVVRALLLLYRETTPDILFMGPMGFVGLWLIVVNWLLAGVLSTPVRIVGALAGLGLVILGASFFFLGGLAVLTEGPAAVATDVDFHIGIRSGGLPGLFLLSIWTILVGRRLLRMEDPR